jgi:hypothetical protein
MNTFRFLSNVIDSLAGPLAVLGIASMLRKPIADILSNVRKISYNNIELKIARDLDRIESTLDAKPSSDKDPDVFYDKELFCNRVISG